MSFSMNLGAWNSVFAVPSAVVDKHIKMAGSVQLKVLLWVLRHAGEEFTAEDISAALGVGAADIRDALQYWVETGLMADSPAEEAFFPAAVQPSVKAPERAEPEKSAPTAEKPTGHLTTHRIPKPDGVFVAQRITQDQEIGFLMQEAQQILGRPISPGLSSTLLFIHDDYGLPVDVILMLLQYVKSKNKCGTSYIESVAKNWAEEGILNHQMAEERLRRLDELGKAWHIVEHEIGTAHRSPSAREEQYAGRWLLEWKFSPKMVRAAYERCVDSINKLSLSYMNRILERWHRDGVTTPQQASLEQEPLRQTADRRPTYDLDEYERASLAAPEFKKEE